MFAFMVEKLKLPVIPNRKIMKNYTCYFILLPFALSGKQILTLLRKSKIDKR